MKFLVEIDQYDSFLTASDWRYSAAIVGLMEYFRFWEIPYETKILKLDAMGFYDEGLLYRSEDITEEKYLRFVENFYQGELQHCQVEAMLKQNRELPEEMVKQVNDLLGGPASNTIMKKTFGKVKYEESKRKDILKTIEDNRLVLTKETYKNKKNLYANYSNTNCLWNESGEICRLNGYYVDLPKKGKSLGYGFDKGRVTSQDHQIFDFIPFAFVGGREKYFINNSASLKALQNAYKIMKEILTKLSIEAEETGKNIHKRRLFWSAITSIMRNQFFDLEIIVKEQDRDFFKTLYMRKESAEILKRLADTTKDGKLRYDVLAWVYSPDSGRTYIDIQKETIDAIINLTVLDHWIDFFLKEEVRDRTSNFESLIYRWIEINVHIRKGAANMNDAIKAAYGCAKAVSKELEMNKVRAYKTKLISSIISHDYDRTCEILLQLSNFSGVSFGFAYDLFEDFESHKDVAYAFINALGNRQSVDSEKGEHK